MAPESPSAPPGPPPNAEPDRGAAGPAPDPRTRARAARELGSMFDDVSGRYDLLNGVMSLGRDGAWRRAMWREVPESARVVLDLCCGSGASLGGLRRPGRLVLGADVSRRMLRLAADHHGRSGWAPRLVCADAFSLPLPDRSVDGITIAFGVRNLRPRLEALAEIARVARPGARLVVLEATAPRPGPIAPLHALYLGRLVPLAGRLSPDPSAYAYLSRSIVEFGSGPEFERDLAATGFEVVGRRSFLLGATALWTTRRSEGAGTVSRDAPPPLQAARTRARSWGEMPSLDRARVSEWRWWTGVQLALSAALVVTLVWALRMFLNSSLGTTLDPWQRAGGRALLVVGLVGFGVRTVALALRLMGPPPRL